MKRVRTWAENHTPAAVERRKRYKRSQTGRDTAAQRLQTPEGQLSQWRIWLKSRYMLSVEQYEALLAGQGGKCAICEKPAESGKLHVDHDHSCCSGKRSCGLCVRGLLCGTCNRMLGMAHDDLGTLQSAIRYLQPSPSSGLSNALIF